MKLTATKLGSLFVIYLLSMSSVYAIQTPTNVNPVVNQGMSQDTQYSEGWEHRIYMGGDPEKDQDRDRDQTDEESDQDQDRDRDRLRDQDDPDQDRDRLKDQDRIHQE